MLVEQLMNRSVSTCRGDHLLDCTAHIMWEHDCGVVPIVDELDRVVGIVTDRDICLAAYAQGRPIAEIDAASVMSAHVHACHPDDSVERAEQVMRAQRIRRLPVTDVSGRLLGLLSLSDIARHLHFVGTPTSRGLDPQDVSLTLEAVSRPVRQVVTPDQPSVTLHLEK